MFVLKVSIKITMFKEFKEFAMKGNVVDMAVGIIIGGAFGKIVSSLVGDVIMPPIGVLLGGVDFSSLAITLRGATDTTEAVVIGYGQFINTVIDFVIVAGAIFMVIRFMNKMKRKEPALNAKPTEKACPHCLSQIPVNASKCKFCASSV